MSTVIGYGILAFGIVLFIGAVAQFYELLRYRRVVKGLFRWTDEDRRRVNLRVAAIFEERAREAEAKGHLAAAQELRKEGWKHLGLDVPPAVDEERWRRNIEEVNRMLDDVAKVRGLRT